MTTRELINETKPKPKASIAYHVGVLILGFCLFVVVGPFLLAGLGLISHIAWNLFQIGWNSPITEPLNPF